MKRCLLLFLMIALPAFAQHSNTVQWTWSQGTGDPATSFLIERSATTGGPYTILCGGTGQPLCPSSTTFTYVDSSGIVGGATWFYVVVATGPGGNAPLSNEWKAVTPFLPPNPASSVSGTSK